MGWQDLLSTTDERVLPWTGGREVFDQGRAWKLRGALPVEHGWYTFDLSGGRVALLVGPADPDPVFGDGRETVRGYLAGNRLIPDGARVTPDPTKLIDQTIIVYLVEPGLERFARVVVVRVGDKLVYLQQEFPQGPEFEVQCAYQDRLSDVNHISGVTPSLDLAFRWESLQRERTEERERKREQRRLEEEQRQAETERLQQAVRDAGTGLGRRALAQRNFPAAARAALAVSGAELLDSRPYRGHPNEMVVQYRFMRQRFECVVEKNTLRVTEAGICLDDHHTGEKGDTLFTLESLPAVVKEAIDTDQLVFRRNV